METKQVGVQKKWSVPQREMGTQVDAISDLAERQSLSSNDSHSPRSTRPRDLLIPPRVSKLFAPKGSARNLPFQLEEQDPDDCKSLQFDLNKIKERSFLELPTPKDPSGVHQNLRKSNRNDHKVVISSSNDLKEPSKEIQKPKLPTTPRELYKKSKGSISNSNKKFEKKPSAQLVNFL